MRRQVRTPSRAHPEPAKETAEARSPVTSTALFRFGRALFGGILAFMALDNLRDLDQSVQYAESRGAPAPERSVPAASIGLLIGGIGVATWRLPTVAVSAIVGFFVGVTPVMHDFWNFEEQEQRQQQLIHFLKNSALLGATFVFLAVARRQSVRS